jgi:hypothetical protein
MVTCWAGNILMHAIEGKIEKMGSRIRRRKLLLDGLKEMRRCRNFKEEALGCTKKKT